MNITKKLQELETRVYNRLSNDILMEDKTNNLKVSDEFDFEGKTYKVLKIYTVTLKSGKKINRVWVNQKSKGRVLKRTYIFVQGKLNEYGMDTFNS